MHLLTSILLLLVFSRIFGRLLVSLNQPAVTGEILAGVLLGPAFLGIIQPNEALAAIAELAVFLVILSAGLEMKLQDVMQAIKGRGILLTMFTFAVPLFAGGLVGISFGFDVNRTVFLALIFGITALPVAMRILDSLGIINRPIGHAAIGVAVLIDLLGLLALGVILDLPEKKSFLAVLTSVGITGGKMIFFAGLVLAIESLFRLEYEQTRPVRLFLEKIIQRFGMDAVFGLAVLFVLAFSSVSETLGFHFVIGAFFGGLLLNQEVFGLKPFQNLESTVNAVSTGFLSPIFFAFLGLNFSLSAFDNIPLLVAIVGASLLSKVLGGLIGGRLANFSNREALGIGILLNSRGIMDLVIAEIALDYGFIDQDLFSALLLLVILSTLLTPFLFRQFGPKQAIAGKKEEM